MNPTHYLCRALQQLEQTFGDIERSSVYRTPAVGFVGDDFLNLVVGLQTTWPSNQLTPFLKRTELDLDRDSVMHGQAARSIDIDLLLYEGEAIAHHDIERYPFVLYPLLELAPRYIHPVHQCTLEVLANRLQLTQDLMRLSELTCVEF